MFAQGGWGPYIYGASIIRRETEMDRIYMDNIAGTTILPEALDAMMPFFKEKFGNPSSIHSFGEETG